MLFSFEFFQPPSAETIYNFLAALKDVFTILGILAGGYWTYTLFIQQRQKETALSLDLNSKTSSYGVAAWLTAFEVVVKNVGKVKVTAREERDPAYDQRITDGPEHLFKHGLDLKIREIPAGLAVGTHLDWYAEPPVAGWPGVTRELNALSGYVKQGSYSELGAMPRQTDFWMEPGESYTLLVPVVLAAGNYLAMVTFIGKNPGEFWQRLFKIEVPTPSRAASDGRDCPQPAAAPKGR